jgi:competence protein ComEC
VGEAAEPAKQETLRRWTVHDLLEAARGLTTSLPAVVAAGWSNDIRRRILFLPVLLGVGVGVYFAMPSEPALWSAIAACVPITVWFLARHVFGTSNVSSCIGAIAAIGAGFSLVVVRAHFNDVSVLTQETRTLTIAGRVRDLEPTDRGRTRLLLSVHSIAPGLRDPQPQLIRISVGKAPADLQPGDWIRLRGTLRPLPAPVAPGSYDFGRKLWFDGIGAVGFSLGAPEKIQSPRPDSLAETISAQIRSFRHAVSVRIRNAMSERTGPIGAAFLTGERGLISEADNEAMRDSSLAHLLSISGLHMVLAGFGFFAALRLIAALIPPIALNLPVKKWAAGAALLASFGYLLLSGASVPTQRSFVMIAIALIAIIFDRSALNMRVVAIAALVILILTPESWVDPSFQMSFGAVVALVGAYEWWNARRLPDAEPPGIAMRAVRAIAAAAITSLIAGLATAPFAAYHFNRFADYGVAANVMVMPIVSFIIMPAGVLALVLMPLGLEWLPLAVMDKGIEAMLAIAHWVASWPGSTQSVSAWPMSALFLMVAGGLWIAIWVSTWRWFGVIPIVFGLLVPLTATVPDIIISNDADNVAVRDQDGRLHLLSLKRGRFDAEMWLRRDGDGREIAEVNKNSAGGFVCDGLGCIASIRGRPDNTIVIASSVESMIDDCARATIVVVTARGWVEPCAGPQLIVTGKFLKQEGALEARLVDDGIAWTSVARERGDRPWSINRPRRKNISTGE